jgi:hypothetical protein
MSVILYENPTLHISFYFMFYTTEDVPFFLTLRMPELMPPSLQYLQY